MITAALAFALLAAQLAVPSGTVVRVGHCPNVTHPQGLIGHALSREGRGWFEARLGPDVRVEWYVLNAGPSAMEAIFAGSLDLAYVGPSPTILAHARSRGKEPRVVAGACNGGAALVVRSGDGIARDEDFRGRSVATPQLGNTQDVAARAFFRSRGFRVTLTGGDVRVIPVANPDQVALFRKGDVDAAFTVEPWVTRLLLEAEGRIHLEEKSLWPETGGRYVTTHLVSSSAFLREKRALAERFVEAHVDLTRWILMNPSEAKRLAAGEILAETGRRLSDAVLDGAWSRIEPTHDPVCASLLRSAEAAHGLGLLKKKPDLASLYDLSLLNGVLRRKGLAEVR